MYIGLGIVLMVIGAVFAFDVVTANIQHVDEHTLGWILLIAGAAAILLSLGLRDRYRRTRVVEDEPIVERRIR